MEALFILAIIGSVIAVAIVVVRRKRKAVRNAETSALPAQPKDPFAKSEREEDVHDPRKLKAGDYVTYLGETYAVRGSLEMREGRYTWKEHFLDTRTGAKCWISVEETPDLEVIMWQEIPTTGLNPNTSTLMHDGHEYSLIEKGSADYTSTATTGVQATGQVEYFDFEGPDGRFLSLERFDDGTLEAGLGMNVDGLLNIYPHSPGEPA